MQFIKQCYCIIAQSVEKIQTVRTKGQKLQGQKTEDNAFIKMCSV